MKESSKGSFNTRYRKLLVHTIVEHTVQNYIWIEQQEFSILFDLIKKLFPNEHIDLYFIPKKGDQHPTGLLFSNFKHRHKILQQEQGIRKNKKSIKPEINTETFVSQLSTKKVEQIRRELIAKHDPWEDIVKAWEQTCAERMNEMMDKGVSTTLPRWPKYKAMRGYDLVRKKNFLL